MKKLAVTVFCAGFTVFSGFAAPPGTTDSPYGICAHLNRWEFPELKEELRLMKEAGIGLDRTDLDWAQVEPKKGKWNFSRWDTVLRAAEENNITILPILGGFQPKWGSPLTAHMNDWKNYITTVVNRYKGRLGYWAVVNEPDLRGEFSNNHILYTKFLKESYDCIKAADPDAIVLNGGLIVHQNVSEFLRRAPKNSFDVLNVHRYFFQDYPEASLYSWLRNIKSEMKKNNAHSDKPLWLTEIGYSTLPAPDLTGIIEYALKVLKLDDPSLPVVLIEDPDYLYSTECVNLDLYSFFRKGRTFLRIPLKNLTELEPEKHPLLLLPMNEGYPSAFHEPLVAYLRKGGTVIFPGGGIPFYFNRVRLPDGSIENRGASTKIHQDLHFSWDAWWRNPKAPKFTTQLEAIPEAQGLNYPLIAERYLGRKNLKPGDELIPIVSAFSEDRSWSAPVAGIYRFNSDLKGNLIALAWQDFSHRTSEEWQAKLLPRTLLLAFSAGVDKVFAYSFRSQEHFSKRGGREAFFGILRVDLSKKPAYTAYATLTKMRPPGSYNLEFMKKDGVYMVSWLKPDGIPVCAVWTVAQPQSVLLKTTGKLRSAYDYLGKSCSPATVPGEVRLTAGPGVTYLEGITVK